MNHDPIYNLFTNKANFKKLQKPAASMMILKGKIIPRKF